MSPAEARDALFCCDPNTDRETWVRILAAYQSAGGDAATADEWSSRGDSYRPGDFAATWRSLRPDAGITEATLIYHAKAGGWQRKELWEAREAQRVSAQVEPKLSARGRENEGRPEGFATETAKITSTRDTARRYWAKADRSNVASHPYAQRKRIEHAFGAGRATVTGRVVGRHADCLLIPNRDWDGELIGVEAINPEGKKQTWGNKGLLVLGNPLDPDALIHVCEGWGTGWALSQLFPNSFACVVTFGCGRLEKTAGEALERFGRDVVVHRERGNRDAWDRWNDGEGAQYVAKVAGL